MCVLLITRLLRGVVRWARKPVNHTIWVAVVTPTDRPKSVRNRCLIELFCDVVCVVVLPFWHFCWYRGFCHRTGSDLLLFVFTSYLSSLSAMRSAAGRIQMSLNVFLIYIYYLCCLCIDFYDLSAWCGCWFVVYIRRFIYKFLNICPFDYTAVAVSGKVGP